MRATRTDTEEPVRARLIRARDLRAAGRYDGPGGLVLSAGAGVEARDDNRVETRVRNVFLEPSWALPRGPPRLALTLGYNSTMTPGRLDAGRLSAKSSLTWGLPPTWRGATVSVDLGWDRVEDRRLGTAKKTRSAALKLAFTPEWVVKSP